METCEILDFHRVARLFILNTLQYWKFSLERVSKETG